MNGPKFKDIACVANEIVGDGVDLFRPAVASTTTCLNN